MKIITVQHLAETHARDKNGEMRSILGYLDTEVQVESLDTKDLNIIARTHQKTYVQHNDRFYTHHKVANVENKLRHWFDAIALISSIKNSRNFYQMPILNATEGLCHKIYPFNAGARAFKDVKLTHENADSALFKKFERHILKAGNLTQTVSNFTDVKMERIEDYRESIRNIFDSSRSNSILLTSDGYLKPVTAPVLVISTSDNIASWPKPLLRDPEIVEFSDIISKVGKHHRIDNTPQIFDSFSKTKIERLISRSDEDYRGQLCFTLDDADLMYSIIDRKEQISESYAIFPQNIQSSGREKLREVELNRSFMYFLSELSHFEVEIDEYIGEFPTLRACGEKAADLLAKIEKNEISLSHEIISTYSENLGASFMAGREDFFSKIKFLRKENDLTKEYVRSLIHDLLSIERRLRSVELLSKALKEEPINLLGLKL